MAFNRYILAFLIFGSFTSCGYYGKVNFQGVVHEMHQGDSIFLETVNVTLYITEERGVQYDNIFGTYTDSTGHFKFSLKPVPFPTVYQLTFGKLGYVSESHQVKFDFTEDFTYNQELHKSTGQYTAAPFERYKKVVEDESRYFLISLIVTLGLVVVFAFFSPFKFIGNIYWGILNFFRKLFQKSFEELSHAKQVEILCNAWCKKCGKCNMIKPKPEDINGIPYVLGTCNTCGAAIEIRLK